MKNTEKALREIIAHAQDGLKKYNEAYTLRVKRNEGRCRFEVQALMGRQEFEEIYCIDDRRLSDDFWVQTYYDNFAKQIATNLKLNKYMWR